MRKFYREIVLIGGGLMEWLIPFIVLVGLIFVYSRLSSFKFSSPPKDLEMKPIKGLKKISDHLERSLGNVFMGNVEERVRRSNKLKEHEYEWRLLDLKRYFVLTAILKETPMFSVKVDELWHEMLMFTREYDDFSKKYLGNTLHHSPNVTIEPDPDLRGFFDWVYCELFFIRSENIQLYKGFFRHAVNPEVIENFRNLPENELIEIYFKYSTKFPETVFTLISAMKNTAFNIKKYDKNTIHEMIKKSKEQKKFNAMIIPFVSVSYFYYDEFSSYMKISSEHSSSSTSCGAGEFCSSDSKCSSSCSSCGGGGD